MSEKRIIPHVNDIVLMHPETGQKTNFKLREFVSSSGLVIIHPSVLVALQASRDDLTAIVGGAVWIIITDTVRTKAQNNRLGKLLGWTDEGGVVSRKSKHLVKFGGIAVDFKAIIASTQRPVPSKIAGRVARNHFDYVKDDYKDGHIHADMRGVLK